MDWLKNFLFKQVLSRWIPFKWVDGHKTEIARVFAAVSGVLLAVATFKPEWLPVITQAQAALATLASLLGIELAKIHREMKVAGGFGRV